MNQAQLVWKRIATCTLPRRSVIEASNYIAVGSFAGIRSFYFPDGSRLWTNGDLCGAAPQSKLREANVAPRASL
jgi:hypothetical protein